MKYNTFCIIPGVLMIAGIIAGCSPSDPRKKDLVPVSGIVLLDGNPIGGAALVFHNDDASKQGGGAITADNGTFSLTTYGQNDGTYPGRYTVTAVKEEVTYPFTDEQLLQMERDDKPIPPGKTVSIIPPKYRLKSTSGITVEVPAKGITGLKIELSK